MIPFGSNLTYIDTASKLGYVATYVNNRAAAQANFESMVAAGQTIAKVFLYHWAKEENFIDDGFTLSLDTSSNLTTQAWANLDNMVSDLKATGFKRIDLLAGPAGNTLDPSKWTGGVISNRWVREALFTWNLRAMIRAYNIDYRILFDGDDYFSNTNTLVTEYAQSIWTWYTTALRGQPKDACFSIPTLSAGARNIPLIYAGTVAGVDYHNPAEVNWPPEFPFPFYGNGEWRSVYGDVRGMLNILDEIGAPADIPWSGSEGYSFADYTSTTQLLRAAKDSARPCSGASQWGIVRSSSYETADHDANPTTVGIPANAWVLV